MKKYSPYKINHYVSKQSKYVMHRRIMHGPYLLTQKLHTNGRLWKIYETKIVFKNT